jgi:predicted nucleic acid-binding protein
MIPDVFIGVNVIDTCALWNLISSDTLFRCSRRCQHTYITTPTVLYECLVKPRNSPMTQARKTLLARLSAHLESRHVERIQISIDDLHEVSRLSTKLGQGELSCAAAARKINQAVMTDNKRDFRAIEAMVDGRLQTTPRLLGWLVFQGHLGDAEVQAVVAEHESLDGPLGKWYRRAHWEGCEKRLKDGMLGQDSGGIGEKS